MAYDPEVFRYKINSKRLNKLKTKFNLTKNVVKTIQKAKHVFFLDEMDLCFHRVEEYGLHLYQKDVIIITEKTIRFYSCGFLDNKIQPALFRIKKKKKKRIAIWYQSGKKHRVFEPAQETIIFKDKKREKVKKIKYRFYIEGKLYTKKQFINCGYDINSNIEFDITKFIFPISRKEHL